MRIGIDARKLHDFGIGTYIRNLLRQLARLDDQTEFVIFCRPEDRDALAAVGENFRPVPETSGNYSVAEQFKIPWALRREGVTLFHAPHYVLPPLVHVPVGRDDPRLHPPDVSAVPAEPAALVLREVVDRAGGAARDAGHDGVGELEARHPALRRHRAGEDRRHLQRVRRALRDRAARGRRRAGARALPAARRVRAVCRQREAAQEPRAADRRVRSRAQARASIT